MGETAQTLDELKYELEKRRFEFEQRKYERDNSFLNKNFGVIITAIVSAATIVVSGSQIVISSNNNAAQLRTEKEKNAAQLDSDQKKSDRAFAFDLAKFMLDKGDDITTSDVVRARYIRTAVVAFFPNDYRTQIARSMRDLASDQEIKSAWADAFEYVRSEVTPSVIVSGAATVTAEQIATEFPQLGDPRKIEAIRLLLKHAKLARIIDKNDLGIFLAAVFFSTDFLQIETENLSYSANRLMAIWPTRFKNIDEARTYEKDPAAVANIVYGGRLGNREAGDGFKYRGRGYLQITGRNIYKEISKVVGVDLEADPDRILEPEINAKAAVYFFLSYTAELRKRGPLDLVAANRSLNGGIVGLSDMRSTYDRILKL